MMTEGRQPETTGPERRDGAGRFMPGNSGRPRGARHAALLALDAIGADNAHDVMQAVVDAARGGDMRAAEILLSRLWPQRKGRPVALDLPALNTAADVSAALATTAAAMAEGTLSPEEAGAVAAVIESQRRAIEPWSWKRGLRRWRREAPHDRFIRITRPMMREARQPIAA